MSGKISRRLTALVLCMAMTFCGFVFATSAGGITERAVPNGAPVNVTIDGKAVLKGQAVIINSVTYVPLRSFSELMGADEISWNAKTNTASVKKGAMTMYVTSGALYISANDRYFFTVEKILNVSGRLYVPIRAIAEAFSASVGWDANSRTVAVRTSGKTLVSGSKFYNSDDVYWLSRIISAEASGESLQGKIAVGNVVLNRKESRQYPNTIYGKLFDIFKLALRVSDDGHAACVVNELDYFVCLLKIIRKLYLAAALAVNRSEELGIIGVGFKTFGLHCSENVLVAEPCDARVVFKYLVPSDSREKSLADAALKKSFSLMRLAEASFLEIFLHRCIFGIKVEADNVKICIQLYARGGKLNSEYPFKPLLFALESDRFAGSRGVVVGDSEGFIAFLFSDRHDLLGAVNSVRVGGVVMQVSIHFRIVHKRTSL